MQQPHSEIMDRLNDAELIRALEAPYEYPREAAAAWKTVFVAHIQEQVRRWPNDIDRSARKLAITTEQLEDLIAGRLDAFSAQDVEILAYRLDGIEF
jgi:hypothetical protein